MIISFGIVIVALNSRCWGSSALNLLYEMMVFFVFSEVLLTEQK